MATLIFSKFIHRGIRNGIIKRDPAITTVEKIVSGGTRMIVYPILLKLDAHIVASMSIIMGAIVGSIVPIQQQMLPVILGVGGAAIILSFITVTAYVSVFGWTFYDYWRNNLYIWKI
jgi:prepilin signal peptidase PulO-like enzyme (type II secretory pathway)